MHQKVIPQINSDKNTRTRKRIEQRKKINNTRMWDVQH